MTLLADLSMIERVLITVVTKHRAFIPSWAKETVLPTAPQDPRTDCTIHEFHCVGVGGVLEFLEEAFTVHRGQYQLNDKSAYVSGKLHRLRTELIRYEVEDGYPVEDLKVFFEYPYLFTRVRIDRESRWLSMFCFARMRGCKPRNILYVEQDQLFIMEAPRKLPSG